MLAHAQRAKLEVSYKPDFKVEGGKLVVTVLVSALPQHLHMTEFDFINTSRLHSLTVHAVPFFASIVETPAPLNRRAST